ncbi:hypothetical protein FG167_00730 [Lacinutrix sp. WUR7]|uniref:hypothetical protein n=1 Tax=Lacinutrix sp. WUR7 TaxID=2653681 RepID=UPI00193CF3F7|nr:hypothetical protein [Lacinutrix sp. WUR7]QRM87802.1 hypothetical protein FG167_00730 [Lacinutrix sp. WUR7]
MNKQVICITGMHRSGTSLLASWLFEQGLKMDVGGLVASAVGNKKGHFEDEEIMKFQAQLIKIAKPESKGWVVKDAIQVQGFKKGVQGILNKRESFNQWGWKDPRSVLLLNEWNTAVNDLKYIFIWREADAVINSLQKRKKRSKHPLDQISLKHCYQTWLHYNKEIIDFYTKNPSNCVLIKLDDFLENDKKVFDYLTNAFELNLNYKPLNTIVENTMFSEKTNNIIKKTYKFYFKPELVEAQLLQLSLSF